MTIDFVSRDQGASSRQVHDRAKSPVTATPQPGRLTRTEAREMRDIALIRSLLFSATDSLAHYSRIVVANTYLCSIACTISTIVH